MSLYHIPEVAGSIRGFPQPLLVKVLHVHFCFLPSPDVLANAKDEMTFHVPGTLKGLWSGRDFEPASQYDTSSYSFIFSGARARPCSYVLRMLFQA
jgi:hypothetical protein